jgi:hypothetical protein
MKIAFFISLAVLFLFKSFVLNAQNIDSININRARNVLSNCFGKTDKEEFWLYSINEDYILIKKKFNDLFLYYVREKTCIVDSALLGNSDTSLIKMLYNFHCGNCFGYTETDSLAKYNYWHKGYIYFLYSKNGEKICEFNLPTLFQLRDGIRKVYPISDKLNDLLFTKVMYYSKVKFHNSK